MPPLDLLPVFNAQPGATLLLSPDWVILGASDEYLAATLTERGTLVGQYIFDAFPDNPLTPEANAVANVRASLLEVMTSRRPHDMAPQHYDVPDPAHPGQFVERYWKPRHTPVLNADGQVQFIIQSVQDITASHHAQQQLQQSRVSEQLARAATAQLRTEFQHFIEQAPVAVAVYRGPTFHIEMANATTLSIWNRTLDQVLHRPVFEALPETATPGVMALFEGVFTTGISHTVYEQATTLHRHGRAEQVYWNVVFEPQRGADGRVTGIFTVGTDVTEQVRARQQLEQLNQELEARVQERTRQLEAAQAATERQRRQWHELFMRAPAAICIFDGPEWVYEFVNSGYQAMFPGRALLGKRLVDALPEVADQPLMDILHRVYDTGEPFQESEVLVPLARYEGGSVEDIYFDLTYLARRNEAGQIDGFVTYAYDVTARVLARREREAQQLLLAQVFEQAPVGVYVMRMPHYVLEVVNEPMARILGRPVAVLRGRPFFETVPEVATQGLPALLDQVWRTQQPLAMSEQPFHLTYHQPGEVGYFSYVYQPLFDAAGHMTALVCVVHEVTAQVLARRQVDTLNEELATTNRALTVSNEELQRSNTQLTRTNVDLDTFVYTASHDLKAPITNIESILHALRAHLPAAVQQDELVAQLLDMLQGTVARFQLTITQLTDISKLQLAHAGPAEPVQLAQMVEDVRQDLASQLERVATHLLIEVAPELVVSFSPANLRSVIYNLLSNASKYRSPARPSHVTLRAEQTPQAVLLSVQDNGLGMSEVQQRQLFGLFQRLHTHVEGTGVGLYIVKRLVENGGGTITVQSQPDIGTTFTVTIPQPSA